MKFPKNTAIQCDTWKQVKAIKKMFGILLHIEVKTQHNRGNKYLERSTDGETYGLYLRDALYYSKTIIHANEYLMKNLKDLTDDDAVSCPTYEDVLILKGLADEAGFDISGSTYSKDAWEGYRRKGYCIRPKWGTYGYKQHYKELNIKIHKLSKFIKMKTPSKEVKKAYQVAQDAECEVAIEILEELHPELKKDKVTQKDGSFYIDGEKLDIEVIDAASNKYKDKGIFLDEDYDWALKETECGNKLCLIPTKK